MKTTSWCGVGTTLVAGVFMLGLVSEVDAQRGGRGGGGFSGGGAAHGGGGFSHGGAASGGGFSSAGGQRDDRRGHAVELRATVVGHDDRLRAGIRGHRRVRRLEHALDDERPSHSVRTHSTSFQVTDGSKLPCKNSRNSGSERAFGSLEATVPNTSGRPPSATSRTQAMRRMRSSATASLPRKSRPPARPLRTSR